MKKLEKYFIFDCPVCNNRLEAKPEEVKVGRLIVRAKCPCCLEEVMVRKTSVTERVIH